MRADGVRIRETQEGFVRMFHMAETAERTPGRKVKRNPEIVTDMENYSETEGGMV